MCESNQIKSVMSPPQGFSIASLLSQVGAKTPDENVESMNNLMETEFDKKSDDDEVDVDEEMDIDDDWEPSDNDESEDDDDTFNYKSNFVK